MFLFPEIAARNMLKALLPYILSILAVLILLLGYVHFTDAVVKNVNESEMLRAVSSAEGFTSLLTDSSLAGCIFEMNYQGDREYLTMKPPVLESFGFQDFSLEAITDSGESPFSDDSLAHLAIIENRPAAGHIEVGKSTNLLLYYPISNLRGFPALARIVFSGSVSQRAILRNRYSIYLISAAVVLLILMPGIFLKLAEMRRQIERKGFYHGDTGFQDDSGSGLPIAELSLPSLLEGDEFPPLLRLDGKGRLLYMNSAAELAMELGRDEVRDSLFHELPCFPPGSEEAVIYPEEGIAQFDLEIRNSSGDSFPAHFRNQRLESDGYAVSFRLEEGSVDQSEEISGGHSVSGEQHIQEGRISGELLPMLRQMQVKFRNDSEVTDELGRIYDLITSSMPASASSLESESGSIEVCFELDAITSALNDVLPDRASIELDAPGFLPQIDCSREDFTQIVKNMVFFSLESNTGPVRIKLAARDVPSPVSDSVFSANCDRSVPRSVSLSYTDGTRIPVVLKEAMMDPETDLSGIQRDFGSHVSSVAAVLARLDCHPVFTEGTLGSTLNVLFRISESYLFEQSQGEVHTTMDFSQMTVAVCDASKTVRENVADALSLMGMNVSGAGELEEIRESLSECQYLILDLSVILDPVQDVLGELTREFKGMRIILTSGLAWNRLEVPEGMENMVRFLDKPYSLDDILDIIELTHGGSDLHDTHTGAGRTV